MSEFSCVLTGFDPRQTGDEESLRVPGIQDEVARPNLCLDLQPKDQRKALQVDPGWGGPPTPNLVISHQQQFFSISNLSETIRSSQCTHHAQIVVIFTQIIYIIISLQKE